MVSSIALRLGVCARLIAIEISNSCRELVGIVICGFFICNSIIRV
ncbi:MULTISPECIES: hypothetical protein [unclassified Bradyrhizobium]|nr:MULTISPECIES: hypothetical protein [unclassified Bradyrhizobium]